RVRQAQDARTALEALEAGLAPDVLVTDLAMAGMDGLALVCAARRSRPGLPALLVTGHAGDVTSAPLAAAAGGGPFDLLRKPVSLEDLSARAWTLVEAGQSAPPRPPAPPAPSRGGARETVRRGLKALVSLVAHA